ncbi:MAG: TetR/AcrR family transcriptional regulator [Chloroflexota bacterium]
MAMHAQMPSRRREIEDAASVLFRDRGYAATSIRDIARELDIRGASLYAHVASKEDVLWAIVDRTASRFERAADDAIADRSRAPDPIGRMTALVRGHVRVITEDVGAASVFISEWRSLGEMRRAAVLVRRDAYETQLRDVIADGVASGDFTMTDAAMTASYLLTALNGIATWYRPDGRLGADRIADHYVDLSLRTLTEDHR